jgi:hypothetical protein
MHFNFGWLSKLLWSPTYVSPTTFYIFLILTFGLSIIISVLFYAVIIDKRAIEQNIISQIQRDAEKFVGKIKNNEMDLHLEFTWINDFASTIKSSCAPVTKSIYMIRYCGYTFAIFNTIMMHFVLEGKLSLTITSIIPLVLSLIGGSIPSTHIIFFGVIESMQLLIGFTIISVGFFSLVHQKRPSVWIKFLFAYWQIFCLHLQNK